MDLLATVRKEGSRGGTGDFKWSDVQNSSHREHYLGHSLHAPVGRWAKNRDLNWYAKGDADTDSVERASMERAEEIKRVKEAEADALARALGLPVPDRSNPNYEALGEKKEVTKLVETATEDDGLKGLGFDGSTRPSERLAQVEQIEGNVDSGDSELQSALKEYRRRHGEDRRPGEDRTREKDHRHSRRHGGHRQHRRQSRSQEEQERHQKRHRSPDHGRYRSRRENRYPERSRSPKQKQGDQRDHRAR